MKILLTGTVQSYADKKETVVFVSQRKTKEGAVAETFYLRFHSTQAYTDFKAAYQPEDGVQVIGLVRQILTPVLDRVSKDPIVGSTGRELRNALLAIEVREHRPARREDTDTLYAHGLVGIVDKQELRQSASGLPWLKVRVAYNHFKRPDEERGQGDFYDLVAFGAKAESLNHLEKGDKLLIEQAVPSANPYEMRDVTHSDGTAVTRNGPELQLREFSYLPRSVQNAEPVPGRAAEAIPF